MLSVYNAIIVGAGFGSQAHMSRRTQLSANRRTLHATIVITMQSIQLTFDIHDRNQLFCTKCFSFAYLVNNVSRTRAFFNDFCNRKNQLVFNLI